MTKQRGLNKGRVDLLLSNTFANTFGEPSGAVAVEAAAEVAMAETVAKPIAAAIPVAGAAVVHQIPIEKLFPGEFQPRKNIVAAELQELADSISQQGVVQPIVVRPRHNKYEIIAGERRWRAAEIAGLVTVPVLIRELADQDAMIIALIENIQRENLNPLEEAYALARLINEAGLTHEAVAKAVGKSRATISNLLRLLQLTSEVQDFVLQGKLELGHAKVLLAAHGAKQIKLAEVVVAQHLSVRETEKLLQAGDKAIRDKTMGRPLDPDIARLQRTLSEKLGAALKIQHHAKGRGKIMIKYNSIDELDGILSHIS